MATIPNSTVEIQGSGFDEARQALERTRDLLLVRCNHCGGAVHMGETCDCIHSVIVNDRGMAFSHVITPEMQTEAACLADDLERAGNIWGAQVVRRLAGLPITQEASP
jgi:hypothetical protein